MREHRRLRRAGGARGEEQDREIVGGARDGRERVGRELARVVGVVHEQRDRRVVHCAHARRARSAYVGDATTSAGSTIAELARQLERRRRPVERHRDTARRRASRGTRARTRARCRPGARPGRRARSRSASRAARRPDAVRERAERDRARARRRATPSGPVLAACRRTAPRFTRREATSDASVTHRSCGSATHGQREMSLMRGKSRADRSRIARCVSLFGPASECGPARPAGIGRPASTAEGPSRPRSGVPVAGVGVWSLRVLPGGHAT